MKSLVPWSNKRKEAQTETSLSPLSHFRWEMDRLFDRFFREPWGVMEEFGERGLAWAPALDVSETDSDVTVRAELPGVKPEELDVSVSGNVLTLSGEKKVTNEVREENCYRSECSYGSFRRSITLPAEVDAEKIEAKHAHGVLTIRMKKRPSGAAKKIKVEVKDK